MKSRWPGFLVALAAVGSLLGCGAEVPSRPETGFGAPASDGVATHVCLGLCSGNTHFSPDGSPLVVDPVTGLPGEKK